MIFPFESFETQRQLISKRRFFVSSFAYPKSRTHQIEGIILVIEDKRRGSG